MHNWSEPHVLNGAAYMYIWYLCHSQFKSSMLHAGRPSSGITEEGCGSYIQRCASRPQVGRGFSSMVKRDSRVKKEKGTTLLSCVATYISVTE